MITLAQIQAREAQKAAEAIEQAAIAAEANAKMTARAAAGNPNSSGWDI